MQRRGFCDIVSLIGIGAVLQKQIDEVDSSQKDGGGEGGLAVVAGIVRLIHLQIVAGEQLLDQPPVVLINGLDERNLLLPTAGLIRISAA